MRPRDRPEAPAGEVADDADVRRRAGQPASPYGAHASSTAAHLTPAPIRAQRSSACTVTSSSAAVLTRIASCIDSVAPCPVPCTATRRPAVAATRSVRLTSSAPRAATTAGGRIALTRLLVAVSAVYASVPGRCTGTPAWMSACTAAAAAGR